MKRPVLSFPTLVQKVAGSGEISKYSDVKAILGNAADLDQSLPIRGNPITRLEIQDSLTAIYAQLLDFCEICFSENTFGEHCCDNTFFSALPIFPAIVNVVAYCLHDSRAIHEKNKTLRQNRKNLNSARNKFSKISFYKNQFPESESENRICLGILDGMNTLEQKITKMEEEVSKIRETDRKMADQMRFGLQDLDILGQKGKSRLLKAIIKDLKNSKFKVHQTGLTQRASEKFDSYYRYEHGVVVKNEAEAAKVEAKLDLLFFRFTQELDSGA